MHKQSIQMPKRWVKVKPAGYEGGKKVQCCIQWMNECSTHSMFFSLSATCWCQLFDRILLLLACCCCCLAASRRFHSPSCWLLLLFLSSPLLASPLHSPSLYLTKTGTCYQFTSTPIAFKWTPSLPASSTLSELTENLTKQNIPFFPSLFPLYVTLFSLTFYTWIFFPKSVYLLTSHLYSAIRYCMLTWRTCCLFS